MTKQRLLLITALALGACTHDLTPSEELKNDNGNNSARGHLSATDFASARSEYQGVLTRSPNNVEANIGWVIADLLLLPDSAPVTELLRQCNESGFDVAADIFGRDGVLARAEASRGFTSSDVTLHYAASAGATYTNLELAPVAIRSQLLNWSSGRELYLSISEREPDPSSIYVSLNPDDVDVAAGVQPLVDGTVIDLATFDGYAGAHHAVGSDIQYGSDAQASGTITFVRAGQRAGDTIEVRFDEVVLPGYCASTPCDAVYRINGTFVDTISVPTGLDPSRIPFADLADDPGPPRRSADVVLFDRCDDIDRAFLAKRATEIGDLLAEQSAHLGRALANPDPSEVRFTIPKGLLHVDTDLPLDITDIYLLKGALDIASAAIEIAAQYKVAEGRVQDMIADYCKWADEDGNSVPECVDTRGFSPAALAMNFEMNLLDRAPAFDLTRAQQRLSDGLVATASALRQSNSTPGLFDFQAPAVSAHFTELGNAIAAAQASITASAPVSLPSAPGIRVHLGSYFTNPLDRARLLSLTGLSSLIVFEPGDSTSPDWYERNDRWYLNLESFETGDDVLAALGGLVTVPPENPVACSGTSCGEGYRCNEGSVCERAAPRFATGEAWESVLASGDEWPAFVSEVLRVFQDL